MEKLMLNRHLLLIGSVLLLQQQLAIVRALDNGLALTPPMGWIAWERFLCETNCKEHPNDCVNSKLFEQMADRIVADGYKEAGYEYVNIDDCWSEMRRDPASQKLLADRERFPNGINGLANYIHSKGLKIGIYGDCGSATCAGYPAQLKDLTNLNDNYFTIDADTFAEWQIDSFKFDGCNMDQTKCESTCPEMALALNSTKRPVLIVCEWPFYMLKENRKPNYNIAKHGCNAWRFFNDVEDSWSSILMIIDFTLSMQNEILKHHGPGNWFDPDMLVIGNFGLSLNEARAQMAIWSIWSAPLYMSNDLRKIDPAMAEILKNKHLIGINQDRLGVFGKMVAEQNEGKVQAFVKPIEPIRNGCPSFAIVYLNRDSLGNKVKVSFALRQLLKEVPLKLASLRYASLNPPYKPGGSFDGEECWDKLNRTDITYSVLDLYADSKPRQISLSSTLDLLVGPSSVRVVTLEISEFVKNSSSFV